MQTCVNKRHGAGSCLQARLSLAFVADCAVGDVLLVYIITSGHLYIISRSENARRPRSVYGITS